MKCPLESCNIRFALPAQVREHLHVGHMLASQTLAKLEAETW